MKKNVYMLIVIVSCIVARALHAADNVPAIIRSVAVVAEKEATQAAEEALAKHIAAVNNSILNSSKLNKLDAQQVYTDPTVWGSFDDVCTVTN